MYALTDDLARRRILYPRPLPTLPDILVIDVPPRFAHASLPLGRFYPILIETEAELLDVEAYLARSRAAPVQPDLLDQRPSQVAVDRIIFAAYAPAGTGWPHVLLCHWPARFVQAAADSAMFARRAYTTEMFDSAEQLTSASTRLLAVLGSGSALAVTLIPPAGPALGQA